MPEPRELRPLVEDLANQLRSRHLTVAVVGDMILDTAIEGAPSGPHPDIGVPVLKEATRQESAGGAGNIGLALSRLGVEVTVFGVMGSDMPGRQLANLLRHQRFSHYLVTEQGWPTPRKDWVYERRAGHLTLTQRIDYDRPLSAGSREELVGEFRARCPVDVDVVVLTDHGLGSIGAESLALVELARERSARVVAIPRTLALHGQPVDAVVINAPELRRLVGASASADPRPLAEGYARQYAQHVFLTLLADGIYVCPADQETGSLAPGYPLGCAHWMGARDMATALVAVGIGLGLDPKVTGQLATAFRHLIASQRGNGQVLWTDIFRFVGVSA